MQLQIDPEFLDFGISAGQKLECTYYRYTDNAKFDQSTCGGKSFNNLNNANLADIGIGLPQRLEGRSLIGQRVETLHTHTGSIRGSFVSFGEHFKNQINFMKGPCQNSSSKNGIKAAIVHTRSFSL